MASQEDQWRQEDAQHAGDCNSMVPCQCDDHACRRTIACVMRGPNRGTRAVFWHPTVWPKTESHRLCYEGHTCYKCGTLLNRTVGQWLCEDKRKAARATTSTRMSPYSILSRTRVLTDEEKSWDTRVPCEFVLYECPLGCDVESAAKWKEHVSINAEITPESLALPFKSDHHWDNGRSIHEKHRKPLSRVDYKAASPATLSEANLEAHDFRLDFAAAVVQSFQQTTKLSE